MDETVRRPMGRTADVGDPEAQLRVVFPPSLVAVIELGVEPRVLGRRPGAGGVRIDHPTVSRRHFEIVWEATAGAHLGADLSSRNGSRLGGRQLQADRERVPLDNGDVLRIGDVIAVYENAAGADEVDASEVSRDALPGDAAASRRLRALVAAAARDPSPVLLVGETGTGKEYVAREIHRLSGRAGPWVAVNCAALSAQLVESQLFGHKKGSFTGAHSDHEGLFRAADGGTIFLDEIGDLPLGLQPKLLRVLQEQEVLPVGATRPVAVDVRVVSATLQDLNSRIDEGSFRLDLYARLSPWEIRVPALRERRADLLDWAERLFADWNRRRGRQGDAAALPELDADVVERLLLQPWRDNLRGLDRWLHRLASDPTAACDLRGLLALDEPAAAARTAPSSSGEAAAPAARRPPKPSREELERVLSDNEGSVRATAKHFERDRRQIYRWLDAYGLRAETDGG